MMISHEQSVFVEYTGTRLVVGDKCTQKHSYRNKQDKPALQ